MSLGMSAAWRAMQPKRKRCKRCGLYFPEELVTCLHCGSLDDHGLQLLLQRKEAETRGNAALGRFFLVLALLIAAMLLVFTP